MTFKQVFLANFLALLAAMGVGGALKIVGEVTVRALNAAAQKTEQQSNQSTTEPSHLNP